jgi:hypothetical protein
MSGTIRLGRRLNRSSRRRLRDVFLQAKSVTGAPTPTPRASRGTTEVTSDWIATAACA